jgi:predicted MPP superfamily phosphohydrolase
LNTVTPVISPIDLSQSLNMRILHLSDLHLENLSISPEKLYEQLKEEKFELIALTGDYLERPKSIPKLEPYLKVIQKLNPKYGTYAVFGNHDYYLSEDSFKLLVKKLENYNIKTMQNENDSIAVGQKVVHIIGIDDNHSKRSNLDLSYKGVPKEGIRIVLTHDPNLVLDMDDYHFDYLLSGHFHGGQICWPKPFHLRKFGKLVQLNLIKGLIQYKGKTFYINEGLGQTLFNIRLGSRPEITIHDLKVKAQTQTNEEKLKKAI